MRAEAIPPWLASESRLTVSGCWSIPVRANFLLLACLHNLIDSRQDIELRSSSLGWCATGARSAHSLVPHVGLSFSITYSSTRFSRRTRIKLFMDADPSAAIKAMSFRITTPKHLFSRISCDFDSCGCQNKYLCQTNSLSSRFSCGSGSMHVNTIRMRQSMEAFCLSLPFIRLTSDRGGGHSSLFISSFH